MEFVLVPQLTEAYTKSPMPKQSFVWDSSRREFIKRTSLAIGAFTLTAANYTRAQGANSRINVAVCGAGGKGSSDTDDTAKAGGHIFALCDVDQNTLNSRKQKYPDAQTFQDYRKMFDKIEKD